MEPLRSEMPETGQKSRGTRQLNARTREQIIYMVDSQPLRRLIPPCSPVLRPKCPPPSPRLHYKSPTRSRRHRWMSSLQMPIHRPSALPQSRTNLAAEKRPPALQGLKIPGIRLTIKSYADIHNRNPNWTETGRPPTRCGDAWLDPRRNSKTRPIPHRVDRICDSLRLQSRNKDLPSPETLTEV